MSAYHFAPFSVPAYILLFIILWMGVCKLISVTGGWRILARDYRANSLYDGQKLWLKSVGMRKWTNYSNCITVGANRYGLYLSVLPIFRIGHPPLFFPWMDISTEAVTRRLLPDIVKFNFTKQPDIPIILSNSLAARIFKMREESQPELST
jgi:hypothetical protein